MNNSTGWAMTALYQWPTRVRWVHGQPTGTLTSPTTAPRVEVGQPAGTDEPRRAAIG
jgi:hypothetical protein